MTSETGKDGALKVSAGLTNGTIKHVTLTYGSNLWYSSMTSQLPFSTTESAAITATAQKEIRSITTKVGSDKKVWNIYTEIIMNGLASSDAGRTVTKNNDSGVEYTVAKTAAGVQAMLTEKGIDTRVSNFNSAWERLATYAYNAGIVG
jgi:hypothetical protein